MNRIRISLIGIDGSGKTAHLSVLKSELESRGLSHRYLNLRGEYFRFFSFPFLLLCRMIGREGRILVDSKQYPTRHPYFQQGGSLLNQVWSALFLLDVCLLALFRGYFLPIEIILCDRCAIDSLVDLMASLKDDMIHRKFIGQLCLRMMVPDMTILLDIDEKKAFRRKPDARGVDYLRLRRPLYLQIASMMGIPIVNSDKAFLVVHREIMRHIADILPKS